VTVDECDDRLVSEHIERFNARSEAVNEQRDARPEPPDEINS
jgi:hypothetical protein